MPDFVRKPNRLSDYNYAAQGDYLVTVCVKGMQCLLTQSDSITELSREGKCVQECLLRIPVVYPRVELVKYTIMPNHFHMLLHFVEGNTVELPRIMEQTKGVITKKIGRSIFQKSYYDHIIRDRTDYENAAHYIDVNLAVWQRDHYCE